ncbi:alpha/beta hydrolase [Alkanindiges sp. WGS2144]|uniref:alpha/beta hydrolase n=1 Tax=Alkanindiges sp. WGS2144 TaxID=3366808 RepID=UPI0037520966
MAQLLSALELSTGSAPCFSVIWLHGLGADANDFVPVVPALKLPVQFPTRFIFPNAPHIPVTVNAGYVMPAWYDILEMNILSRKVDLTGIQQSVAQVNQFIQRENERGIPAERIFLAGFSQGGAIAYQTALTYSERLAGVLALSTYIPDKHLIEQQFNSVQCQLPVFVAHGLDDEVVSPALAQQAFAQLKELGVQPVWHHYPMAHEVCMQEVDDIAAWLVARMHTLKSAN